MIEVVATIYLQGLRRGEAVWVDPHNEYVAACIAAGYLVPTGRDDA